MLTKSKAWLCRDREFATDYVLTFRDEQPEPDEPAYKGTEFDHEWWEDNMPPDLHMEPGGEPIAIELTVEKARE